MHKNWNYKTDVGERGKYEGKKEIPKKETREVKGYIIGSTSLETNL
jgi:hypothetical protein